LAKVEIAFYFILFSNDHSHEEEEEEDKNERAAAMRKKGPVVIKVYEAITKHYVKPCYLF
jgi:hypothetical protein